MAANRILEIAKQILRKAAELGVEEAGTRIAGSAWPYIKKLVAPVFSELERRYPKVFLLPEETDKAIADLGQDPALAALLEREFAKLHEGHAEIMTLLAQQDETLREYRVLIVRAFEEADRKGSERHEELLARFEQVDVAVAALAGAPPPAPQLSIDEIYKQANAYQNDAMKWIMAGDAETATQRLEAGRKLALGGLTREPKSAKMLVTLGYLEKSQAQVEQIRQDPQAYADRLSEAARYFAAAIQADRQDLSALNGLANIYLFAKDYDRAIGLGLAIVGAAPTYGAAVWDLSLALEERARGEPPDSPYWKTLETVYNLLEALMPQQPQSFPAAYLARVQKRKKEIQELRARAGDRPAR